MVCIQCGSKTQIINSRLQKRSNQVWRRRRCLQCSAIVTTIETVDYSAAWIVAATSGALQPFWRDKLFMSLHNSLQHRQTALSDASGLADTIISKLRPQVQDGVLTARVISQTVQVALNRFDTAASTHYQAFHT